MPSELTQTDPAAKSRYLTQSGWLVLTCMIDVDVSIATVALVQAWPGTPFASGYVMMVTTTVVHILPTWHVALHTIPSWYASGWQLFVSAYSRADIRYR